MNGEELRDWFRACDAALMGASLPWPASWGGNVRVDDGLYVSERRFEEATGPEGFRALWLLLANEGPDGARPSISYEEASRLWTDGASVPASADLLAEASRATDSEDACCFYTEEEPEWLDTGELAELAAEREDLCVWSSPSF